MRPGYVYVDPGAAEALETRPAARRLVDSLYTEFDRSIDSGTWYVLRKRTGLLITHATGTCSKSIALRHGRGDVGSEVHARPWIIPTPR